MTEREWAKACFFLMQYLPGWTKEVPEGLGDTFYGTLSAGGDRLIKERIDSIREAVEVEFSKENING